MKKKRYRVAIDLDRYTKIFIRGCIISFVMGLLLAVLISGLIFKAIYDRATLQYDEDLRSMDAVYAVKTVELQKQYNQELVGYETTASNLEAEIEELKSTIAQKDETIQILQQEDQIDFDLVSKYWYILRDAPKGAGITLDHIRFSDEVGKRWNINPHLMWAIYEVESSWNIKSDSESGSSARGLGQVLESTARSIWEKDLGHGRGSYTHSMAYDPYVNIEISTALIGKNLEKNSLRDTIALYRGGDIQSYYNAIINSGKNHGIVLSEETAHYQW